ncbi:hypothetical protein BCU68_03765 [Vibrio sp. 10N.286.49.B3]|uniref:hypothetical protein n=1 Tax=Vibrio sp. 10N.286.49.B3 TaxID=1880855 RepID=UPI000C852947|nr:hypothetical protein [Vibrio sp. 10N.286.49.B3]PMH43117.1 hypothetical protein BCU68_03765 [Vibrio sp. 10N.286.49.B3]
MNLFKTSALSSALLAIMSTSAYAEDSVVEIESIEVAAQEQELDPSDMTRANTSMYVALSNEGAVKASGSLSYTYQNGQMSMVTLEGSMDSEGEYSDSRLQYFHVFNTGNSISPRVAASLDIIDNDSFTTAAVGAISIFRTPNENLTFFGRVGALAGEYSDSFASDRKISDKSIVGGMAAAYAVLKTGNDGTYLALYPEYTYLHGDVEMSTVKTTFLAATPMSEDKTRWGQFKLESSSTSMTQDNQSIDLPTETVAWFQYKVFF